MNPSADEFPELDRLLDGLVWSELPSEELAQLERILCSDDAALAYYRRYVGLHVMLDALSTPPPSLPLPLLEQVDFSLTPIVPLPGSHILPTRRIRATGATLLFGVAVSLVVVGYILALAGLVTWDRIRRTSDHEEIVLRQGTEPAATLTRADDVSWKQEPEGTAADGFAHRTLRVRRGWAELTFAHGAHVWVKGPAEFEVRSPSLGFLRHGRLTAKVPQRAIGFVIDTPTAHIVDLGTEFEVEVSQEGGSEVRVRKGAVEASPQTSARTRPLVVTKPTRLSAGQGLRVSAAAETAELLAADSSGTFQVRRSLEVEPSDLQRADDAADVPIAIEPGQLSELKLWLRADLGVISDDEGRVKLWEDQSGNGFSATQVEPKQRPRLLDADLHNGLPAVVFDGEDDFLDSLRPLGADMSSDFTFFIVCKMMSDSHNTGIFSLRDKEYADWNSAGGFAFSRGVTGKGLRVVQAECAHKFGGARVEDGHDALSFETGSGYAPLETTLVATLKKGAGTAVLWANGLQVGADKYAMKPADDPNQGAGYVLGARAASESSINAGTSFFGRSEIAEIVLYGRALNAQETKQVNHYLSTKYLPQQPRNAR